MINEKGFTLIELITVVAIIGILASITIPTYQTHAKKTRFAEVVLAADSVKTNIEVCFQRRGLYNLSNCDSIVKANINPAGVTAAQYVQSVNIAPNTALITITGTSEVDSATYTLLPTENNDALNWTAGGTCITAMLC